VAPAVPALRVPAAHKPLTMDALILGGGPAGAAAAIALAGAGRQVTLIERTAAAVDKVCGDFISADAIDRLASMGCDVFSLGAERISRLRLIHRGSEAETRLPFTAAGLSRRTLDEALLTLAASRGAVIRRGHTVRSIRSGADGPSVRVDGMSDVQARHVFLATGKHDLRDLPRPGRNAGSVGFKMYYRLAAGPCAALRGAVELVLFPGGYAGLQVVESDRAVLCVTVGQERAAAGWPGIIAALRQTCLHLDRRLAGAIPLIERPLAVAGIPYGYLKRCSADDAPWLFRLGDQASVIPSLTGDGIAIALHGAALAARLLLSGGDASAYHRALRRDLRWQMRRAAAIRAACTVPAAAVGACRVFPWIARMAAATTRVSFSPTRG
jgi:menaquinone-9 beta-reductase